MGLHFAGRRTIVAAAFAVALALTAFPAAAVAKTTFTAKSPAPSSSSTRTMPTVSVYVVDSYGIKKAANFSMTVDGKKVTPKITYKKKGDYKRVTLSFRIVTALKPGTHGITVRIKNIRKKTASTTWIFKVAAPVPPPHTLPPESEITTMPISIAATACLACHVGYPSSHRMTDCAGCHSADSPPRLSGGPMNIYTPADESAHTLACSSRVWCHGSGSSFFFPHVLDSACSRCHTAANPAAGPPHPVTAESAHITSNTWCVRSGCHTASLTREHGRYSVAGVKLSCATCHSSTDPRVIATIKARSTACDGCHVLDSTHPVEAASHTVAVAPTCLVAGCHTGGTAATAIHAGPGCSACHRPDMAPTIVCATCHATDGHPSHAASPAPATMTISGASYGTHACTECHPVTELRALHGGDTSCRKCHPTPATSAKPWLGGCVQGSCHASGALRMHATIDASHTLSAATGCTAVGCHTGGTSVAAIHKAVAGRSDSGCGICHATGATPTLVCASAGCHSTGATAAHTSHPSTVTSGTITIGGTAYGLHRCSECHASTELQAVHGGISGCGKCHPSPRNSITAWNGGCVQGACHASGTPLAMHGGASTAHVTSAAAACTGAGCHEGGSDVAAIHAKVAARTDSGCGICHAVGRTATLTCATTGCHTGAATSLHASHPAKVTSATITIAAVSYGKHSCSECHATTELQAVHGGAASCAKCHPSPRGSFTAWAGGCVQGGCHVAGTALAMHGAIDTSHTLSATPACTVAGCHTGGTNVAAIHKAVAGRTDSGCGICHAAGRTATLTCTVGGCHPSGATPKHVSHPATLTSATMSVLGTSYGKHLCSECHATTELQVAHGGTGSCATCHPSPRSTFTAWAGGCVQGGCHVAGSALAMHGSIDTSHTAPTGGCVSAKCHGSNVVALHAPGRGCAVCHKPGVTATKVCTNASCHGTSDPHPAHPATVTTGTVSILGASFGTHSCSECHSSADLRDLHGGGGGCASCHPSPRDSFTTWNHGCVQGGCHKAGTTLAMHASIDSSHTAPAGTCVSANCHVANVATLHAPGPGCAACHATGKTLTVVCGTSGCHPGGLSSSHTSHPATVTSGTITINSVAYAKRLCAECHTTTELQAAHGGTGSCSKCHPSPRASFTKWNGGCVQGTCHATGALAMHGSVNTSHTVAAAGNCTLAGCHTGGTDIAAIHAAITGVSGSGCSLCHAPGKKATAVCGTTGCHSAAVTALHASHPAKVTSATVTIGGVSFGKHLCSECHATTELQVAHGGTGSCSKCHPSPRGSFTTWAGGCVQGGCHVAGSALAMHGSIDTSHTAPTGACVTSGCHGSNVAALHASGPGCPACHKAGQKLTLDCGAAACHPSGASAKHASHPARITTGTVTILGTPYAGQPCLPCHTTLELQAAHGGRTSCAKCHPSPRDSYITWNGGCVQGGCHAAGTAREIHRGIDASHTATVTPTCTLTECHTGGTDVAKIHAGKGGCADCHGTGKTPSLDCTTCHDADLVAAHAPYVGTSHQVSSASCVVAACHAGKDAAVLHQPSVGCAACHTKTGTASVDCLDCHRTAIATKHPTGDAGHAYSTHPCNESGCHLPNSAAVHAFTDHSCGVCHKATGTTASACTNCHSYSWASRHSGYLASNDYHGAAIGDGTAEGLMGQGSAGWILPPYTRGNAPVPNANLACSVCHDPVGTRNYYNFPNVVNGQPVVVTSGTQYINLCVACHGGTVDQWHIGCLDCHAGGHAGNPPQTLVGSDCSACHHHGSAGWPHGTSTVYGPTL